MILDCKKCNYNWNYKGGNPYWATCPKCLTKVKISKVIKDDC